MAQSTSQIERRLASLEAHLAQENPILLRAVKSFRDLDVVARRLGFFSSEESYATRVPWWPLVSILGTYSAGKSTFINSYLGYKLQLTGNQAVDDKFSVICFGSEDGVRVLPGSRSMPIRAFPSTRSAVPLRRPLRARGGVSMPICSSKAVPARACAARS